MGYSKISVSFTGCQIYLYSLNWSPHSARGLSTGWKYFFWYNLHPMPNLSPRSSSPSKLQTLPWVNLSLVSWRRSATPVSVPSLWFLRKSPQVINAQIIYYDNFCQNTHQHHFSILHTTLEAWNCLMCVVLVLIPAVTEKNGPWNNNTRLKVRKNNRL